MSPSALAHLHAFVEAVARDAAREAVKEALANRDAPEYATARHNPLGSKRSFLNAARANKFRSFKRGRETAARWEDVAAYIESTARTKRKKASQADVDVDRLFDETFGDRRRRRA